MKTFDEIADAVMTSPHIESGLVQQTRAKDVAATTKDKSGIPDKRVVQHKGYRVFVVLPKQVDPDDKMRGKVHCEESGTDLMECVRKVFSKLEIPMPTNL